MIRSNFFFFFFFFFTIQVEEIRKDSFLSLLHRNEKKKKKKKRKAIEWHKYTIRYLFFLHKSILMKSCCHHMYQMIWLCLSECYVKQKEEENIHRYTIWLIFFSLFNWQEKSSCRNDSFEYLASRLFFFSYLIIEFNSSFIILRKFKKKKKKKKKNVTNNLSLFS